MEWLTFKKMDYCPTHDSELQFTLSCVPTLCVPGRRPVGAGPLVQVQARGSLVHKASGGPHRVWGQAVRSSISVGDNISIGGSIIVTIAWSSPSVNSNISKLNK